MTNTTHLEEIKRRIEEIEKTGNSTRDDIRLILVDLRLHLESLNWSRKYRELMFYCNWSLHNKLDRGIVQEFLKKIAEVTTQEGDEDPSKQISEIISTARLRLQIIEILQKAGISTLLFDNQQNWKNFFDRLLPFLIERPLQYKKGNWLARLFKWIQKLRKEVAKEETYIRSFSLLEAKSLVTDHPLRKGPNLKPSHCFWRITVMPFDETFEGPLYYTEDRSAFKS